MTATLFPQDLLDACISCGYCLPDCPTYALTKDEGSSPRGRINLMKSINAGLIDIEDPVAQEQASFCLGCRACEPACPAGVRYGELIERWRDLSWGSRGVITLGLTTAVRWRSALRFGGTLTRAEKQAGSGDEQLMLGCFERILYARLSRTMGDLFPDIGIDPDQGCCGALHAHNGYREEGRAMARDLGRRLPGTIVTTSGGCAAHLAEVLGRDRVRELSEWIVDDCALDLDLLTPVEVEGRRARIAIQDSCHLRNGLGVWQQIRVIVDRIGERVELPSASVCCGAAGTYSILRKAEARAVYEPRLAEVAEAEVDFVAVVNPGCYRQVKAELRRLQNPPRVLHLVELIAQSISSAAASGGGVHSKSDHR